MTSDVRSELAMMVHASRDLMTLIDADLVYREANRAYLEARGLSREQVVGRRVSDLWGHQILDSVVGESLRRSFAGEPVRYRAAFEVAAGRPRTMEVTYDPVAGADGTVGYVVVTSRDLSGERVLVEDLQATDEAAEERDRRRAADFERAASAIAASAESLIATLDTAGAAADLVTLRQVLARARQLAGGILQHADTALSVGEAPAGRGLSTFHLVPLLKEVCLVADRLAAERALVVLLDTSEPLPERVRADRLRLREVLGALLERAVSRTERGSVALRVRADGVDALSFEVRDGGVPSVEPLPAGLRAIAARLGARLELKEGEATSSARLFLPLASDVPSAQGPYAARDAPRVLVVDDNPVNREVASEQFAKRGLAVDVARSGAEALARIERGGLDLVLLDWRMPDLDGLAVARLVRQREAALGAARLPLVGLTASAVAGDREQCLEAGMDDYLTKPLHGAELDRVLERWLPASGATERPALDLEALSQLEDPDDPSFLGQLADLFLEDAPPRLERLLGAIATGDVVAAREAAHALRGSAANIGALPLAELCRCAEEAALDHSKELAGFGRPIARELARASAALRRAAHASR